MTAQMVRAAALYGGSQGTCLSHSLTIWWLLRWQGIASDLHIGVQKTGGRLEAHAWVEYRGVVVNDPADLRRHFVSFDRPVLSGSR